MLRWILAGCMATLFVALVQGTMLSQAIQAVASAIISSTPVEFISQGKQDMW